MWTFWRRDKPLARESGRGTYGIAVVKSARPGESQQVNATCGDSCRRRRLYTGRRRLWRGGGGDNDGGGGGGTGGGRGGGVVVDVTREIYTYNRRKFAGRSARARLYRDGTSRPGEGDGEDERGRIARTRPDARPPLTCRKGWRAPWAEVAANCTDLFAVAMEDPKGFDGRRYDGDGRPGRCLVANNRFFLQMRDFPQNSVVTA